MNFFIRVKSKFSSAVFNLDFLKNRSSCCILVALVVNQNIFSSIWMTRILQHISVLPFWGELSQEIMFIDLLIWVEDFKLSIQQSREVFKKFLGENIKQVWLGETCFGWNVIWVKRGLGETCFGRNVLWAKRGLGETWLGETWFGWNVIGWNEFGWNVFGWTVADSIYIYI